MELKAKINSLETGQLKEMAVMLFDDVQDGADLVFAAVLGKLETIMNEDDFINFCDGLG